MGKSTNHTSNGKRSRVQYMTALAEGLPKGWRVEIKTRESGTSVGNEYKCYVAPVSGRKFYSKVEVYRYLKSKPQQERSVLTQPKAHVVERRDTVDGLPPGWTLELHVRKKRGKIRSDPYYTDPLTGYRFRSKKDVLRYLKTGEVGKDASKPKKGDINNVKQMDVKTSPPSATKRLKLDESPIKRDLCAGQCSKSIEAVKDEPILEPCTAGGEVNSDLSSLPSPDKTKNSKKSKGRKVSAKKWLLSLHPTNSENQLVENGVEEHENRKTRLGCRKRKNKSEGRKVSAKKWLLSLPPTNSENQLVENDVEEHENSKTRLGCRKHKNKIEYDTPRRVSKRLAAINAELASDMEKPNEIPQVAAVQPPPEAKLAVNSTLGDWVRLDSEHLNQLESEKEGNSTGHAVTGEDFVKQEGYQVSEEKTTTAKASRDEAPLEHGVSHVGTGEETTKLGKAQPLLDHATFGNVEIEKQAEEMEECPHALAFGELWRDPCLDFAYKTLTGAIPVEDNLAVAIPTSDPCIEFAYRTLTGEIPVEDNLAAAVPCAIPLSDPCLEFAYKTLTGEIPLEDSLAVQDYFQHQLSCTQPKNNSIQLPDFSIDGFFDSTARGSVLGINNNIVEHPSGGEKMDSKQGR